MGKNNRARRAAKAHHRRSSSTGRSGTGDPRARRSGGSSSAGPSGDGSTWRIEDLFHMAAVSSARGEDSDLAATAIDLLAQMDGAAVGSGAEGCLRRMVTSLWGSGWQPAELARQIRRSTNGAGGQLGLLAIAADHHARAPSTLDPRWAAQISDLELPELSGPTGWLQQWSTVEGRGWREVIQTTVSVLEVLVKCGPLPTLIPPPGSADIGSITLDLTDADPVLAKVRALLAQAESTSFEAEAETFTAKAQALMTRHAIDVAMLDRAGPERTRVVTVRIPVDAPYIDAKSLLLHVVADASRCKSVIHEGYGLSSVTGFPDDVTAVEVLFTSLLVQAQASMRFEASTAPAGGRRRSSAFRSTFLRAYASRVGERLREINEGVVADAEQETGRSVLPVLAARSKVVEDAVTELFPNLRSSPVRGGYDAVGWASGRLAADRARLNIADLPTEQTSTGTTRTPAEAGALGGGE